MGERGVIEITGGDAGPTGSVIGQQKGHRCRSADLPTLASPLAGPRDVRHQNEAPLSQNMPSFHGANLVVGGQKG